jgi:DUF971 family protein
MDIYPTKLALEDERHLRIDWSDGQGRRYRFRELRDQCPCATCREKRKQPAPMLPVLRDGELQPVRIQGMKPVGNYAYSIEFTDGHDTGIYTFELLRELGQVVEDSVSPS